MKENIITPFIVLLELSYRADKEGWNFKQHLDFIKLKSKITVVTEDFVLKFGSAYNKTKNKVSGIGMADVIVLLTATEENAKILTGDQHFKDIPRTIFLN